MNIIKTHKHLRKTNTIRESISLYTHTHTHTHTHTPLITPEETEQVEQMVDDFKT